MQNTEIETYWQEFCRVSHLDPSTPYSAWAYGYTVELANELAELTVTGVKTATTSAAELYELGEPKPYVGEYNIILNGDEQPVCITQTTVVETIPYNLVSAEYAYHEGEGDRSLSYWREVHEKFFKSEYAQMGKQFHEKIPCVCEVFKVVYDGAN